MAPGLAHDSDLKRHFEIFPKGMVYLYDMALPLSVSMVINFLIELTSHRPEERAKIFKTELMKVFLTSLFFYAFTIGLTTWLETISRQLQVKQTRNEKNAKDQRELYNRKMVQLKAY
jgi:hypothetical protein